MMKNFKVMMPVMAFVMAVGLAFANKANVESSSWVERDGVSYQLQNEPCTSTSSTQCKVIFASDPTATVHQVFMDESLETQKLGGSGTPYIINE